ncbi:MAG: NUDIX domain-containing protein [Alphaproteobacteria bacterium]|nr:NUDIX domain-containing protein [Alphaproteobacteria bacterium]
MPKGTSDAESTRAWRPEPRVRATSIGVVYRGDAILVMAVLDDRGDVKGWRPPGGGIELGERAADALVREIAEEIEAKARIVGSLGVMENIYDHHGTIGHEIVFVFEVELESPGLAVADAFSFRDGDFVVDVAWRPLDRFRTGADALFPVGLLERLRSS